MSDSDLAAGGMYNFGQENCKDDIKRLITKLLIEGKEIPQEIKDFCGYDEEIL